MTTNFKWPILELDFDKISSLSRSQAGQDVFVVAVTQGKKNGRWLEIGSGHPKCDNNTWLLEKEFSWTGDSVDCINPVGSPKQQAWVDFYRDIRSCFGNAIPSEWIPNPKNLEALPTHVQQELIELHKYDLYVGKLSDDPNLRHNWDKERPKANLIIANAFDLDFANFQGPYDYLQIDIDNHANHCKLLQSIIQFHEFSVITFEHDFWQKTSDTALCRDQSRQILQSAGYILLCTDVTIEPGKGKGIDNEPMYFEDWYVHPSRIHKEIIDTYKFVSKHPRPLYYTDILFSGK